MLQNEDNNTINTLPWDKHYHYINTVKYDTIWPDLKDTRY